MSVTTPVRPPRSVIVALVARWPARAAPPGCRRVRERRYPPRRWPATRRRCTSRRARPLRRLTARLQRAGRRPLLDPRDSALRRHEAPADRASRRPATRRRAAPTIRAAVSAARPHDHARSAVQHRVPVWRDFPRRAATRAARAGPIWPSRCSKRACATDPIKWEYMQDIGFVHYWWRHDYPAAAELVRAGQPRCPGAPVVAAARWPRPRWRRAATAGRRG